jgi:3'(2'), 5'-bisphosphate nucleotidase
MSDLVKLFSPLKEIMFAAGKAILEVYEATGPIEVTSKSDDSPVTKADHAAHHIIEAGLNDLPVRYPVLSEEGSLADFDTRSSWPRYWLVDPLDGTKEFINKNGEFTVNIALIENGQAILGMVYVPVTETFYYGAEDAGAFKEKQGQLETLKSKEMQFDAPLTVVGSRRHGAEALDALIEDLNDKFSSIELISMGSSLKICACAEGSAHWYPRLALTSEWDTAAAHAVLKAAGGEIYDDNFEPLQYNQKDSLLNPFFHAVGDTRIDWPSLLKH